MIFCLFNFLEISRKGKHRALEGKTDITKLYSKVCRYHLIAELPVYLQSENIYCGHMNLIHGKNFKDIYRLRFICLDCNFFPAKNFVLTLMFTTLPSILCYTEIS